MLSYFNGDSKMQKPIESHTTIKDQSHEELKGIHAHREKNNQNCKIDDDLIQRAWHTVHRIAAMLYEEFGVNKVAVFGSLAEQNWFTEWSDIDIAVWGIPIEKYLRASSRASEISGLFNVDLVDFECSKELFQKRIESQLIQIEKGAIYRVNRTSLYERIKNERTKIQETIVKIYQRLAKIKIAPAEYREEIETTIAKDLVDCYRGMENIFKHIAINVDLYIPDGSRWHKELLTQMVKAQDERPPVISDETYELLQELLEFRHVFNNIYGQELVFEKTEQNALHIGLLFEKISNELDAFIDYLKKQENE